MTHPSPKRKKVPKAALMRSGLVSPTTARPVNTAQPRTTVNSARPMTNVFNKAHSTVKSPINNKTTTKNSNFDQRVNTVKDINVNAARPKAVVNTANPKEVLNAVKGNQVNAVKASAGNPQKDLQDQGVIDSGCSRHMIGNMSYLTDFEEIDGGYVSFGGNPKGGKITGRGAIKTDNLDFENVYFVRELQFNLFSVSQMCDKKNSVLFNDTECIVLSPNFKLTDESHVLLKVSRKNNMYSVDLKNIVPKGGLTCLFAKATSDESKLYHRSLGHINFKTMNKLVKGNLVRGLPSKLFKNDQTYVSCQKGKKHRDSCKSKTVSSISQPLYMLHMDLFGSTFVKSLMKKMYCLVVTNDYSRFSWVFILATKDETSGILKSFITGVKNLIDQRVKIIRCDNGTQFKNKKMNQFCERKVIKREFSVAKTPQQNEVAERKNKSLIEVARTMLANSKLPTTFWAEAINTACYVQNRVLVTKPYNKTPCELFLGRKPALGFMRPFGCPVIILNTIDHLGKFDGKADEGFFVGYSINSKEFRVQKHVMIQSSPDAGFKPLGNNEKKVTEEPGKEGGDSSNDQEKEDNVNSTNNVNAASINKVNTVGAKISIELLDDPNMPELEDIVYLDDDEDVGEEADLNTFMPVSPILTTRIHKDNPVEQIIGDLNSTPQTKRMTKNLEEHGLFSSVQQRTNHKDFQIACLLAFYHKKNPKSFSDVKTASTPMETHKPLLKDTDGEDVDEHLYRSMIGSLMYLTSSRLDIMFVVCACARFQVNPKISHLHAVKRIFRYLKGASLDRKSTTGSCQFLRCRLISWQCKKHTVTKIHIDNESTICKLKNPVFHSKTKHIKIKHHFIRDSNEKKLIQMIKIYTDQNVVNLLTKAFDVSRFQYLIASIGMLNL
ncbi:putative ribonuclease H-like domain-containing protein [Tanacetum coccineum]|uniref:Ribonuclease H-like domain-containing protein n=1 Tax=Tanacetum coccineum TaxID=301880 RepID=A0ABQ5I595_9ASTR